MERGHRGGCLPPSFPLKGGRAETPRGKALDASSVWPGKEVFYFSMLFCNCHAGGGGVGVEQPRTPQLPSAPPVSAASICSWVEQRAVGRFLGRPRGQILACHTHLAV